MKSLAGKILLFSILALAVIGLAFLFHPIRAMAAPGLVTLAVPAPQADVPPAIGIVDVYFVLATIAFFKVQFGWQKWQVLVAAGVLCLIVGLGPQLQLLLPWLSGWFDAIVGIFKLLMYSAGSYDLATDVGPKVLTALKPKPTT